MTKVSICLFIVNLVYSEHFENSLHLTRLNEREKGDQGDTARVLDKLSKARAMTGDHEGSKSLRLEADRIYIKLVDSGKYLAQQDDELKWESLVCIKSR